LWGLVGGRLWRGLLDMLRNPLLTAFHALGGLLLGLLLGIIFFSGACLLRISVYDAYQSQV
jgi:hypothetical protein